METKRHLTELDTEVGARKSETIFILPQAGGGLTERKRVGQLERRPRSDSESG